MLQPEPHLELLDILPPKTAESQATSAEHLSLSASVQKPDTPSEIEGKPLEKVMGNQTRIAKQKAGTSNGSTFLTSATEVISNLFEPEKEDNLIQGDLGKEYYKARVGKDRPSKC